MTRRKKGRPVHGWLVLDKPAGMTSTQAVGAVRRLFDARKAGHAGTLDPFATGLLLVLLGRSTKLAQRFVGLDKRYLTEIDLAARTSTADREGDVIEQREPPEASELDRLLQRFHGEVDLPVPAASAIKVGGERAYKLHRRGVAVEMPVRRSTIHELALVSYDGRVATLDLLVGSGTYVRSIADELGGHCRTLRRTEIGPFRVEDADDGRVIPSDEALAAL
jgi:tRNA pseudouridine55 synthase